MKRAALLVALAGCALEGVDPAQVLAIVPCPGDQPCAAVADGASPLTVAACTDAVDPPQGLEVELEASAGGWIGATATTTTERVALDGCATATLVVPWVVGAIRLDARSMASASAPVYVELAAVDPTMVELEASPPSLGADGTQARVTAKIFARSGRPSTGTLIRFEATAVEPADAFVDIRPRFVQVRDQDDLGEATLVVEPTVTQVEVTAVASHPATDATATESMIIRRFP